ncbi:MAG: site-specific integrase [Nostoc sp. NOS(2021)]|uniref:site-specific integrase n=1 Tax=Nostoc sp. NOS(2021) TaxID=2815407 RepID=UPI0025EA321E|nr:site-specific integrase [Nostoc sp. NOS(2021)]MBN3894277.1 site-specific integrase [Nostoc sp. NOS(2021)]
MVNSAKTPTGRAKKGLVTIRPDGEYIKACFPRSPFPGEKAQVKRAIGIPLVDGWEGKASQLQSRLQLELDEGKLAAPGGMFNLKRFNEILVEYKLRPDLKIVESAVTSDGQLPPKPQLSLMEVWDMYCEHRKHGLAETTYELMYKGQYSNYLQDAIVAVGCEDAIKIKNWLIENRSLAVVKCVISNLSKAYHVAIRQGLIKAFNPFEEFREETAKAGKQGYTSKTKDKDCENDKDILDKSKAYTWNEVEAILEYVKDNSRVSYWYNFIKFKFLTGVRTGEAIGLWWRDVKWENECLTIQRTYSNAIKKTLDTKNETPRFFPMPRDGELWKLLKSIPQGKPNDTVFKSKTGKIIGRSYFNAVWSGLACRNIKGIIPELIEQGKLTKYLPPYNTRHTFITHQVFEVGVDEKIVGAWCEHSETTSRKHYQDIADRASRVVPGYGTPATTTQQVQQQSEIDLLREQNKLQQEQVEELKRVLERLTKDS